ncbi:hypothetical protein COCON_G00017580 [Conger conger]|uniref:Nucleolar and spindle-associated protein 1 n=1 Tax=Conger conger TaxID=82655 RepID=A0A9Q1E3U6_CONCO|nr:hypothetical protein COCON_G00017580 [Conger conger]
MDLDSLKYADLQRLAKDVGLKANMKADKLLKALKEYYNQQSPTENAEAEISGEKEDSNARQPSPNYEGTAFVTERRARGQKAKRKHLAAEEPGAERDGGWLQSSTQEAEEEPGEAAEGAGSSKRRKLSSQEDSGTEPTDGSSEETEPHGAPEGPVGGEDRGPAKPAGRIPRHEGLLKKTNRPVLKPTTPNFKKLHEAHFNKMESIDLYLQRKNKQMEAIRNPVKELQMLSEKANILKPVEKKAVQKPKVSRGSLFSPVPRDRGSIADKRRLTQLSASKPALKTSGSFRPSVLSTRRMNVSFSQMTQDNEHKRSLVKTPARMSPHVEDVSTPTELLKPEGKKPAASSTRTPGVKTFVFSGNTSFSNTPGTQKKNAFDLKASLSRPLSYQPHKGKLKPFSDANENAALNTSQSHQKKYKQHQVQTRVERRTRHAQDRKQKKEKVLGARRGLAMS